MENLLDSAEMKMQSDFSQIPVVHSFIRTFCHKHKIEDKAINTVNLSLEEILTNIVKYGSIDEEPIIIIRIQHN